MRPARCPKPLNRKGIPVMIAQRGGTSTPGNSGASQLRQFTSRVHGLSRTTGGDRPVSILILSSCPIPQALSQFHASHGLRGRRCMSLLAQDHSELTVRGRSRGWLGRMLQPTLGKKFMLAFGVLALAGLANWYLVETMLAKTRGTAAVRTSPAACAGSASASFSKRVVSFMTAAATGRPSMRTSINSTKPFVSWNTAARSSTSRPEGCLPRWKTSWR